jgi:redox-sensitive bicupin YhaK (pirin superfamily)
VTRETTAPLFLDLHLPAGTRFEQALPIEQNAFIYVYRGAVGISGQSVPSQRMAILANDADADGVVLEAAGESAGEARVLLIAGYPLREPIVQHGPFVMNTMQEIQQAVRDYSAGRMA